MPITSYLSRYCSLFIGRRDDYDIQLKCGRYRRAGKPLTTDQWDEKFGKKGKKKGQNSFSR